MITLILCILLNVLVAIIFRMFPLYKIDSFQAIVVNYFVCMITASVTMGDFNYIPMLPSQPWMMYAAVMGLFFFVIFNVIAQTVANHGVMVTTTAQKLSLLLPVIVAVLFFGENFSLIKILGIIAALAAVYLVTYQKSDHQGQKMGFWMTLLPLLTWIGSSMTDLSLYLVDALQIAPNAGLVFTSALFLSAGCFGLTALLIQLVRGKVNLHVRNLVAGIVLGVPNFFSIYLILKLLEIGWNGSVVFPLLNVSIILLSAILGYVFFKEEINTKKAWGFAFAILAIVMLSIK